ncbi:hypothetical protein [Streptomyces sp. NPDC101166]|uniref:hypothetical protein n=1 Tax=Streptomyces sp. NPDC101166 TaxID=3366120 RepID=UPI0037F813CD
MSTALLPPAAAEALARLESAFADRSVADVLAHEAASYVRVAPEIQKAVIRYGVCSETIARLGRMDGHDMTPAQFDALYEAQGERARMHALLANAGQLHLVEGAR